MSDDPYQGPEEILFEATLDEFAKKVGFILRWNPTENSASEAYSRIKDLWKLLKRSKKNLLGEQKEKH